MSRLKWEFQSYNHINENYREFKDPVVWNGIVFAFAGQRAYAIDRKGEVIWSHQFDAIWEMWHWASVIGFGQPSVDSSGLYFLTGDLFKCFDLRTGKQKWYRNFRRITSSPGTYTILGYDKVYLFSLGGVLMALEKRSGEHCWLVDSREMRPLVVDNNNHVLICREYNENEGYLIIALNSDTGSILWKQQIRRFDDLIASIDRNTFYVQTDYDIRGYHLETGEEIKSFNRYSNGIVSDGLAYLKCAWDKSEDGFSNKAIDVGTNEILWTVEDDALPLVLSDGIIFSQRQETGDIIGRRIENGQCVFEWINPGNKKWSKPIVDNQMIYFAEENVIYAIEV